MADVIPLSNDSDNNNQDDSVSGIKREFKTDEEDIISESVAESSTPQEDENIPQNEGSPALGTDIIISDVDKKEEPAESQSASPEEKGDTENKEENEQKADNKDELSEVAHWCRPCRLRILPATEATWDEHAKLESHKVKVEETKARISEIKKVTGKTDDKAVTEEDIDQVTVGRWCKVCNWFVPQHIGWNTHNRDRRHKKNALKKGSTDDDAKPGSNKKYMCVHCEEKFTYPELSLHIAKEHVHKILKPNQVSIGREKGNLNNTTSTFKMALKMITSRKDPMVGLDFITEYQRKPLKPFFICDLCHSVATGASPLVFHLSGLKHKTNYWRCVASDQYEAFKEKGLKGIQLASGIQRRVLLLQKKHGRGKMNVLKGAKGSSLKYASKADVRRFSQKRPREWNDFDDGYMSSKRPFYDRGLEMNPWMEPNPMMDRNQEQFFPNMADQFFSPNAPNQFPPNISEPYELDNEMNMDTLEKFKMIEKLFDFPISTKSQETIAGNIIATLKKKLLQYKIQNIPDSVQDVLAKSLFGEDGRQNMDIGQGMDPMEMSEYREFRGGPSGMNWRRERSYSSDRPVGRSNRNAYDDEDMQANQSGFRRRFNRNGPYRPQNNQNERGNRYYSSSSQSGWRKPGMGRGGFRGKGRRPFN